MTGFIYHITSRISWSGAQKGRAYSPDSLEPLGYIHCSKPSQILNVANTIFVNQHGLVILAINSSELKPEIRWEPGLDRPDELFPHIYGPLNLEAVAHVFDFEPGPDGIFSLPEEIK
jgi:uncharacterized protein (DUF952 family)